MKVLITTAAVSVLIGVLFFGLLQYGPLGTYFVSASEKSNAFQSVFTFLAFATAMIGVVQYIVNSRKKIKPSLKVRVKGQKGASNIAYIPKAKSEIKIYLKNEGNRPIESHEVNLFFFVPEDVKAKMTECLGDKPRQAKHEVFPGYDAFGKVIMERVMSKKLISLFIFEIETTKDFEFQYYFESEDEHFPSGMKIKDRQPVDRLGKIKIIAQKG